MLKYFLSKKIAFKLIIAIFFTTAIIFLTIIGVNYYLSKQLIEKDIEENAKELGFNTVNKIEKILVSVQKIVDNTSVFLEKSDFTETEINTFIETMVQKNEEIFGATIAFEPYKYKKDKKYFAPYYFKKENKVQKIFLGSETYDYFILDWYQIPKELNRSAWMEPYFDEGGGNVVMTTYSSPFYRTVNGKKELLGIITADISLDWLQNIVNSIKTSETGYGFLLSRFGVYVTHPFKERIMNQTIFSVAEDRNELYLKDVGRDMIGGKTGSVKIKSALNESESYLYYYPIKSNGWSLGIVYPIKELMQNLNKLNNYLILIVIAGLTLIFFVIFYLSRSITKPIADLSHISQEIANGNYDVKVPEYEYSDEIGQLTESFEIMGYQLRISIDSLKQANEDLEKYSRNLEEKVKERTAELVEKNDQLNSAFTNIKTIGEIGRKITSTLDLESIFSTVHQNVKSLMFADTFLLMLHNSKANSLECKLAIENDQRLPEFSFSLDDKNRFGVWCFDNKEPVFMNDVSLEYSRYIKVRQVPKAGRILESIIYQPLLVEDKVIGVISCQSFEKNAYTTYQLDILGSIANYAAIALVNAMNYDRVNNINRELKEAQAQLVQAEKMASLGQLTAGIAHEIKNPLNFINNFSELSIGLVSDIDLEILKYKEKFEIKDIEYINELMGDLQSNVKKINEHGKRADSIVKGMLLHSRGKSGEIQKADINAILQEYLNLAYHGFRAQDSKFNMKMITNYDRTIPQINVVPQNISRVFLNIINNACYSINEKSKEKRESYFPSIEITTKNLTDKVEIKIRDNGRGISQEILDKIFNPFFTTKPAGKGTGLGLSLSYDIIVQEHKGQLIVNSAEGEFAEFVITIPKDLKQA